MYLQAITKRHYFIRICNCVQSVLQTNLQEKFFGVRYPPVPFP
jgi:hypothetical protein